MGNISLHAKDDPFRYVLWTKTWTPDTKAMVVAWKIRVVPPDYLAYAWCQKLLHRGERAVSQGDTEETGQDTEIIMRLCIVGGAQRGGCHVSAYTSEASNRHPPSSNSCHRGLGRSCSQRVNTRLPGLIELTNQRHRPSRELRGVPDDASH